MSRASSLKTFTAAVLALGALASALEPTAAATRAIIVGPAGSDKFGEYVHVLSNGHIVVVDQWYDLPGSVPVMNAGAVFLYDGGTRQLISVLTGSRPNDFVGRGGITELANGNFVVSSSLWNSASAQAVGAVTWVNAVTGLTGTVSPANSLVGGLSGDVIGANSQLSNTIVALPNGNYVVVSPQYDNGAASDAGAVTWANGATGITGTVNAGNSLLGSAPDDHIGTLKTSLALGITVLRNSNVVIASPRWDNGTHVDAGAATWMSGTSGRAGVINTENSLVGARAGDFIGGHVLAGNEINPGVFALANGHYVVVSPSWDSGGLFDAGAVTWGNGNSGASGVVGAANSLVGAAALDSIGSGGVTALADGSFVVSSPRWSNGANDSAGAVTWFDGTVALSGTISAANSLVGNEATSEVGSGGVIELTGSAFVVSSPRWDSVMAGRAGAVTRCASGSACTGTISTDNSLTGGGAGDHAGSGGVTALPNGGYVVVSPLWDNGARVDAGAVTWCDRASGCSGVIGVSNSLLGGSVLDNIGSGGVTVLSNGNYVVDSPRWSSGTAFNVGAVTWGSGALGVTGTVSAGNSLVGALLDDMATGHAVVALANGNYVVVSPGWDNGANANVGAATWGDGVRGSSGVLGLANSLIGVAPGDMVGSHGVLALSVGNYAVASPNLRHGMLLNAGAVTWGDGARGTTGTVNVTNSLIGARDGANLGLAGRYVLPDGSFAVESTGPRLTWVYQPAGLAGLVSDANSVAGSNYWNTSHGWTRPNAFDAANQRLVVGDAVRHSVTVIDIDPEIALSGAGRAIAYGAAVPNSTDGTDFGVTDVDAGALTRTFVISNTGEGRLDVSSIVVDNAAFAITSPVSASVAAGGSLSVSVSFNPAQAGVFDATVVVRSNDVDENEYRFALRGAGQGGSPTLNRRVYVPLMERGLAPAR